MKIITSITLALSLGCSGIPESGPLVTAVDGGSVNAEPVSADQLTSCAALGGTIAFTDQMSYMYQNSYGVYQCDSFHYDRQVSECVYSTVRNVATADDACASLPNTSSCRYSVTTFDRVLGNIAYVETDYYNLDLWDASDLQIMRNSCSNIGGVWQ